jgi:hypothetical protein
LCDFIRRVKSISRFPPRICSGKQNLKVNTTIGIWASDSSIPAADDLDKVCIGRPPIVKKSSIDTDFISIRIIPFFLI